MAKYDASTAECLVFTYKDGLLSRLGHDLKLRVTSFEVEADEAAPSVSASFDASSLRVDCAVVDGEENPHLLTGVDQKKIAGQIAHDVLHAEKFPEVRFTSSKLSKRDDGGYDITGTLTLHGVAKEISIRSQPEDGKQVVDFTLHQPDYDISPYRAVMGTLKIKPEVRVRLALPVA
ncbi:YceI family protein [Haliangium ochraceum]|uniref:YceI family protein n=1 Tax=Haliangium ochraceum (strain DSM 14365 / JCM 11303 / SMP-2) TaxID=502025 RepID=D0LGI5_HALO1|nr:YceI family protein [Haliangium ochraceum]ACY12731.1 YceI family protein [Haliangium ochraceum DSM 14365]